MSYFPFRLYVQETAYGFIKDANKSVSILCGDLAIKQIEEPFVDDAGSGDEWAI